MRQVPELAEHLDDLANQLERRLKAGQPPNDEEADERVEDKNDRKQDAKGPSSKQISFFRIGVYGAIAAGAVWMLSKGGNGN